MMATPWLCASPSDVSPPFPFIQSLRDDACACVFVPLVNPSLGFPFLVKAKHSLTNEFVGSQVRDTCHDTPDGGCASAIVSCRNKDSVGAVVLGGGIG